MKSRFPPKCGGVFTLQFPRRTSVPYTYRSRNASRHRAQKIRRRAAVSPLVEYLESRALLSVSPLFSIPGLPGLGVLKNFPAITNIPIDLGSLSSYLTLNPSDQWWLDNTGQTLSNNPEGPATGTPGADISALDVWSITQGSSNVVIAVLDTGVDLDNENLASHLWTNPGEIADDGIDNDGNGKVDDVHGWNFLNNSGDVTDNFVHGTAVSSAILSVAPNITILPIEIGTASGASDQDVIDGINYIISLKKQGVNIAAINASYISFSAPSMNMVNAIKNAGEKGMLFVAAAGNAGMNLDNMIPNLPAGLSQFVPSFLPSNLIFVAATDNQDNLASFSDYGKNTVAIGAPGVDMALPIPGGLYAPLSGTSFAAPMVSGIVGLLKSQVPDATASQMKNAILRSGDPDPALAGKTITGKRVNAARALYTLMGAQPPEGAVTLLNNEVIQGWAWDPAMSAQVMNVQITIDGVSYSPLTADSTSDDLPTAADSPDHGFTFGVPELGYGKHTVKVTAMNDLTGASALIGKGTLIVDTDPTGELEALTTKTLSGWAYDSDTPSSSIKVKLFVDGRQKATATANISRSDLVNDLGSANHGYSFKLNGLSLGVHQVEVYAVDSLTGALTLIGSQSIDTNTPPTGQVETLTATTLSGWAFDANSASASIQIQYQIDDLPAVLVTAKISRPDLKATLGSKNHGFSVSLPPLPVGDHTVSVWAVDPKTHDLVLLTTQTISVPDPLA
jgi:hypothetical protein